MPSHSSRHISGMSIWRLEHRQDSNHPTPLYSQQPTADSPSLSPQFRLRERERPSDGASPLASSLTVTDAERERDRDLTMDRAVRKARRQAVSRRRAEGRKRRFSRAPLQFLPPAPIYAISPFAGLPVIPSAEETLQSALIRVDKVPKSPGFPKQLSRIRGKLAKYSFIARAQLVKMEEELAEKLQARIDAFPLIEKPAKIRQREREEEEARRKEEARSNGLMLYEFGRNSASLRPTPQPLPPAFPSGLELHPFDQLLLRMSVEDGPGGIDGYIRLLNQCRNLVHRLKGLRAKGTKGLNNAKNMIEAKEAHVTAIKAMRDLWKNGIPPSEENGMAGQRSGMDLVESLRVLSRSLRHLPTLFFDRNLLAAERRTAPFLHVMPPHFFTLPSSQLTFALLRPYLPPSPTYTLSLVGAPNVGKSSLLSALSSALVRVSPSQFTTKAIQVGHMDRDEEESPTWEWNKRNGVTGAGTSHPITSTVNIESTHSHSKRSKSKSKSASVSLTLAPYTPAVPLTRIQLVDTPGLLFRPDHLRKDVEQLTLGVCQHIQPLLLGFVLDESGTSGSSVRSQSWLRREMQTRFRSVSAPHPRVDDDNPANIIDHDSLHSNVIHDEQLMALTHSLREIPWIDIRSKADLSKKSQRWDEAIVRQSTNVERMLDRAAEQLIQEQEREDERMEEEERKRREAIQQQKAGGVESGTVASHGMPSSCSPEPTSDSSLPPAPSSPAQRLDRAAAKMHAIQRHMRQYLTDESGQLCLDEDPPMESMTASKLLGSSTSASTSTSASSNSTSSTPVATPRPAIRVSVESGRGLSDLIAAIWSEVDRRESLRLERCYLEMKRRIEWMRGWTDQPTQPHPTIQWNGEQQMLSKIASRPPLRSLCD